MDDTSIWVEILQKCPSLYREGFLFECGPGWFNLIKDLSLKIEKIIQENDDKSEMFAVQVKEKYGTLRFYMSSETERIIELIQEAETASSQICEVCGEVGKIRGVRWFEVRCDKCYK